MKFLFFIIFCLSSSLSQAESLIVKVVGVTDGDSITVIDSKKNQLKVRLEQIDAPELGQPYGNKSKQALSELVFGKTVNLVSNSRDKYGRTLGRIYLDDTDINAEMIKQGMAWVYRQYSKEQDFIDYEETAKLNKVGLWSPQESERIPPWEWRRGKGKKPDPKVVKLLESKHVNDSHNDFKCGDKTKCSEMTNCSEAFFYLKSCGLHRLDNDKDGVPCESICK
jgi:endonuclease YncB( thermonuclease family)